jgi:hypothetical protein
MGLLLAAIASSSVLVELGPRLVEAGPFALAALF